MTGLHFLLYGSGGELKGFNFGLGHTGTPHIIGAPGSTNGMFAAMTVEYAEHVYCALRPDFIPRVSVWVIVGVLNYDQTGKARTFYGARRSYAKPPPPAAIYRLL
jgi:hypothetical protein